ncbi:hypothetical protein B0H10DRAFT_2076350 [Mycena sp. CBHHK59/15]|nr:hypothetical protein B0H10DRAFT_2127631 [Mycena sp. CBHHK59/15]KAJ6591891.1 hypothetical protein B0H10DRAFT_2090799 [Mycena sp. CBHHK59/15]KAJ6605723.1 hypothetical protein B0H10DRAFT_2076338 [Mycena sp. CBHHK59/15]KAJ6605725.1 hypothetical protein B0H10DRAFT_2076350 [Mycena sp. CBHHK59/15]
MRDLLSMAWRAMSVVFVSLCSGSATAPRCARPNPGFSCCTMCTNGSLISFLLMRLVAPPINVSPNTRPVDASTIVEAKHLPIPASSRVRLPCAPSRPTAPVCTRAGSKSHLHVVEDCLQSSSMVRNQGNTHEPQPTQPKLCATARC